MNSFTRNGMLLLLALCICSCTILRARIPENELENLDPDELLEVFWDSSLQGDVDTIKRITGPEFDSMVRSCPEPAKHDEDVEFQLGTNAAGRHHLRDQMGISSSPELDSILVWARVIEVRRKPLGDYYLIAERKLFGREARFTIRPKQAPNGTNSLVIFLLNDGRRWRLVSVVAEADLRFIGNTKFGEPRTCPDTSATSR